MAGTGDVETLKELKGFQRLRDIDLGFLGEHIGFQVHVARRALRQTMREFRADATPSRSGTTSSVVLIGLNPGISLQEIAASLFLDPSNVTLLVKQLLKTGLIETRPALADRRRLELYLTDQGKEELHRISAISGAQEGRTRLGLTARERKQLVTLLVKLQDSLR